MAFFYIATRQWSSMISCKICLAVEIEFYLGIPSSPLISLFHLLSSTYSLPATQATFSPLPPKTGLAHSPSPSSPSQSPFGQLRRLPHPPKLISPRETNASPPLTHALSILIPASSLTQNILVSTTATATAPPFFSRKMA